jgi:hypothetical protein
MKVLKSSPNHLPSVPCPLPHLFTWLIWGEYCSIGGVLMVSSDCKTWVQTGRSSALTCYTWICSFTVVLTSSLSSATISPLHRPPEKEKVVSFSWAVTLPLQPTPWLPKVTHQLSLERLWHRSHCPASLTDYHENHLILVDLSLIVPLEFLDLHSLWPLLTHPSLPNLTTTRRLEPGSPPWVTFGHRSCSPASPSDFLKNHLI